MLQLEAPLTEEVAGTMKQKMLSNMVDKKVYETLLTDCESTREKARLNSVCLPHAGDWLYVVPSPTLGLQLRPQEFRTSALYRLGMPVFEQDGDCVACGLPSDKLEDHSVGCAARGERMARHNCLRDALFHAAVSAQLARCRE